MKSMEKKAEEMFGHLKGLQRVIALNAFIQGAKWNGKGEWQLCPKCNGNGEVYEQRGTPGMTDITLGFFTCGVCNGAKVLARPIGNPNPLHHNL